MCSILDTPPQEAQADLDALKQALDQAIPKKKKDNVLIATWNIRRFGADAGVRHRGAFLDAKHLSHKFRHAYNPGFGSVGTRPVKTAKIS